MLFVGHFAKQIITRAGRHFAIAVKRFFSYFLLFCYFFSLIYSPLSILIAKEALAAPGANAKELTAQDDSSLNDKEQKAPKNAKAGFIYVTKRGDNLAKIAASYNISPKALFELNKENKALLQLLAQNLKKNKQQVFAQILPASLVINVPAPAAQLTPSDNIRNDLTNTNPAPQSSKTSLDELGLKAANLTIDKLRAGIEGWGNQYGTLRANLAFEKGFAGARANLDLLWPFYDRGNLLIFGQSSLNRAGKSNSANFGLGQRYFAGDYMLGLNSFLDYDFSHKLGRWGVGAEYWRNYVRLALNSYMGLGAWRPSSLRRGEIAYEERAASGFDVRLSSYLPFYPQIAFMTSYERYFGKEVDLFANKTLYHNPFALTLGVNYKPISLIDVDLSYKLGPRARLLALGVKLAYQIGVPLKAQLDSSNIAELRSLKGARYSLVERNNNIVLAYKRDIPVILNDISGFAGEQRYLVAKVNFAGKWQIKGWRNKHGLILSPNCYQLSGFAGCKVTLPPFRHDEAQIKANQYDLTLILQRNSDGQEFHYQSKVQVKAWPNKHGFNVTLKAPEQLTGAGGVKLFLFDRAELKEGWHLTRWQLRSEANKDWQDVPQAWLNGSCFKESELSKCRLTLPPNLQEVDAPYDLRVFFNNKISKEKLDLVTQFVVLPSHLLVKLNDPIKEVENSSVKLFKSFGLSSEWLEPQWQIAQDFFEQGGELAPACYSLKELAKCTVFLPRYIRPPDGPKATSYKLTLLLSKKDGRTRKDSWNITVLAKHQKARLVLKPLKSELVFGEKVRVKAQLYDALGKNIAIAPKGIARYFKLELLHEDLAKDQSPRLKRTANGEDNILARSAANVPAGLGDNASAGGGDKIPARSEEQSPASAASFAYPPAVTDLKASGDGSYEFTLKAGSQPGELKVKLSYGDVCEAEASFFISSPLTSYEAQLQLSSSSAMLKDNGAKAINISYGAKLRHGPALAAKDLILKLVNEDNKLDDKAAAIFNQKEIASGLYQADLWAKKPGIYELMLYHRTASGSQILLLSKKLHFISGKPSDKSKLYFKEREIAADNSAGLSNQFKLIFEAYDEYGEQLAYDALAQDDSMLAKNKISLNGQMFDLTYEGGNRFSFSANSLTLAEQFWGGRMAKSLTAHALYDGEMLGISATLLINANKSIPNNISLSPQHQILDFNQRDHAVIEYNFSKYGLAITAPEAPISFKVFKISDETGSESLASDAIIHIGKTVDGKSNKVSLMAHLSGHYAIRAYYKTFQNPPRERELKGSKAIIEIAKLYDISKLRDSQITVKPKILRAEGDFDSDRFLSSQACVLVMDNAHERRKGLSDVKGQLYYNNKAYGQLIELTEVMPEGGIYCGKVPLFADGKWLKEGEYQLKVIINEKMADIAPGRFLVDVSNLDFTADIKLSSKVVMEKSAGGRPQFVEYDIKTKGGYEVPYERIRFIMKQHYRSGSEDKEQLLRRYEENGKHKLAITARYKGIYTLEIEGLHRDGSWRLIKEIPFTFTSGLPAIKHYPVGYPNPLFEVSDHSMAPDNKTGHKDYVDITLKAVDINNAPLDYDDLASPDHAAKYLKLKIFRMDENSNYHEVGNNDFTAIHLPRSPQCPQHNCYRWRVDSRIFKAEVRAEDDANPNERYISIVYKDEEVTPKDQAKITLLHMLSAPNRVEINPRERDVFFWDQTALGPSYEFYWENVPYSQSERTHIEYELWRFDDFKADWRKDKPNERRMLRASEVEHGPAYDNLTAVLDHRALYVFKAYYRAPDSDGSLHYIPGSEAFFRTSKADYEDWLVDYRHIKRFPKWLRVGEESWAKISGSYIQAPRTYFDTEVLKVETYLYGFKTRPGIAEAQLHKYHRRDVEITFRANVPGLYQVVISYRTVKNRRPIDEWRLLLKYDIEVGY